jgi:hypothetical protein
MLKKDAHRLLFSFVISKFVMFLYHLNFASDDPSLFMSFRLYVVKSYMIVNFHNHVNILALVQVVCDCAIYIHPIIMTALVCLSFHRMYASNLIPCCHLSDF